MSYREIDINQKEVEPAKKTEDEVIEMMWKTRCVL